MQPNSELSFLKDYNTDPAEKYRQAEWLLSSFDSPIWLYNFDYSKPKKICWDIRLDDGSSLLEKRHLNLLNGFRYWLIIATQRELGPGTNGTRTQSQAFYCTLYLIDHLLLYAERYTLAKTHLAGISTDELKMLLTKAASSTASSSSLLEWEERLSLYIFKEIEKADSAHLNALLIEHPYLKVVTPEQEDSNTLNVDLKFIPLMRAWLYYKKFYVGGVCKKIATVKLSGLIYPNTLLACSAPKPSVGILSYSKHKDAHNGREMIGAPINRSNENKVLGLNAYNSYFRPLYCLGILHKLNIPAPSLQSFREIQSFVPSISQAGRFLTLPTKVAFDAVKDAIEFHLKYGKALIDSYCRLAVATMAARKNGNHSATMVTLPKKNFIRAIDPKLKELGVTRLGFSIKEMEKSAVHVRKGTSTEYYKNLRENKGLLELLSVYVGCVQIVVGALVARRHSEMVSLNVDDCLDQSESWLIFANAKSTSGLWGFRNEEARPIDPIAVKMINQLQRMQKVLKRIGVIDELGPLFSTPEIRGHLKLTINASRYNKNMDLFCDYFEVEQDVHGRRYYIRQHTLRRFFAMLFFHSSAFGGIDTLRWMLGHTDLKHVWHYITESTPGRVLRATTAQWTAENLSKLSAGNQGYKDLVELIYARFGVKEVSLVETEDLEGMIEELLLQGSVDIEPEFFEDENGQQMQIMCKVVANNDPN